MSTTPAPTPDPLLQADRDFLMDEKIRLERENAALLADRQKYASEVQTIAEILNGGKSVAPFREIKEQAEELMRDKARLDWLLAHGDCNNRVIALESRADVDIARRASMSC